MADDAGMALEGGVDALPQHLLNKTNRELTGQIAFYESEVERTSREVDEHKDRLKFMLDHLGNVKAEIVNTQSLFDAKRREIESEDHMAQLAERERGRILQKIAQIKVLQSESQEKCDAVQNRIFQGNLRMDEFKAAMNFNQEELEQWDLARKQKEDDGVVVQKYSKADEGKLKDLNLQVEKLSKEVQHMRNDLESEITETRSSQIELDKTAEDYRQLHHERAYLLSQWEEAVKSMHRRDNAIKTAGDRYAEGKVWIEKRMKQLKTRREFHDAEVSNNKEMQLKIEEEERVQGKYREDFATLTAHLTELDDELEVLRNELNKAQHDKSNMLVSKESLMQELAGKQQGLERMTSQHDAVIAKLSDAVGEAENMSKQNKLVADLLAQTEQSMKQLDKEMTRIKDEQYHNSEKLYSVRREQSHYLAEISGAQAQARNMAAKISQLDAETFKQQELLYTIEFNIQQMERKVNRAKGERTEEEKKELQEKIEMLQKMLDDLVKQHKVLDTQVKRVNEDLRQSKYDTAQLEKEKARVTEDLLDLTLENESCQIELQRMIKEKEEGLVNADVLKLQVERMRKLLLMRDDELLGLENRKQQLAITIAEREAEIQVHHEVLKSENKSAEEERRQVAQELVDRIKQVDHLKNRFQVLIGRMERGVGEMTHAQHIVNTAKEREELQAKGDTLDAAIKQAEHESRKLDVTIATMKGSNAQYKHQFTKVAEGDDELAQQKTLQQKNKELQAIINRRTNEMKEFLRTEMAKMSELQDHQRKKQEVQQKLQVLQEGHNTVQKDVEEQRELVARYDVAITKAKRAAEPEIVQDISLLEEHEKTENATSMLLQLAAANGEEAQRTVEASLQRQGIELPTGESPANGGEDGGGDTSARGESGEPPPS